MSTPKAPEEEGVGKQKNAPCPTTSNGSKTAGMKRMFAFFTVIIAIFLLATYFWGSIRTVPPFNSYRVSIEKVIPFDSFRSSMGKVLSLAHLSLPPLAVSPISSPTSTTQPGGTDTASSPGALPEQASSAGESHAAEATVVTPVLELTKVPLTGMTESFTTLDGEQYTGVIKRVEPDGIVLRTSDGVPKLKFKNLPPEIGAKYGYDPELEIQFLRFRNREDVAAQQNAEKIYAPSVSIPSNALPSATSTPSAGTDPQLSHQTDSLVQNGDFSHGKSGWYGDGQPITDYLRYNPQAQSTNLPANGLIIELSSTSWTKLYQRISGDKNSNYVLKMTYALSPGISLSTIPADYLNIIAHTHILEWEGFQPINLSPGQFFDTVKDTSDDKGFYEKYSPHLSSTADQIYEHDVPPLPPSVGKIVAVAFPPGKGFVFIKSISVTSH